MFVVQNEKGIYFLLEALFVLLLVGVVIIGVMFLQLPNYKEDVAIKIANAEDLIRILSYMHKADPATINNLASKIFTSGDVSIYLDGVEVYKKNTYKGNECFYVSDKVLVDGVNLEEKEVKIKICR